MFQKEFAERIAAEPHNKSYGSLSVFCQLRSDIAYEETVPKEIFKPIPKVDSAIISIYPKPSELSKDELRQIEKMVKSIFTQRRKKLHNVLANIFKDISWQGLGLDLDQRPENLSPDDFVRVYRFLSASRGV